MSSRSPDYRFITGVFVLVLIGYYAIRYFRERSGEVNPHDPSVRRIDTFELQPGEIGVVVRVRAGVQPVAGATVWADQELWDDEDTADEVHRKGQTDSAGLVKVPARKGDPGQTRLFVRDASGRVSGGLLQEDHLLSAPDLLLVAVAPRTGRLVTTEGQPIPGAVLTAESFFARQPAGGGEPQQIAIPNPVQPDYTVRTDAAGRFSLPGIPIDYNCWLAFRTARHGEGRLLLPAGASGECRLALAGGVRVRVSGDGSATDVKQLRCYLGQAEHLPFKPDELRVDGHRTRRHDGTDSFVIANVVPGEYRLQIEGTPRNPVQPAQSLRLTIEPGRTGEAVIPLKRAGLLQGRAVDAESGAGIKGVRFNVHNSPTEASDISFSGRVTTDTVGSFSAFVPAGTPVALMPDRCPRGYNLPWSPFRTLHGQPQPETLASGETKTLPDIKLYRQGVIAGTVVADNQPAANAVVEVRWDDLQRRKPATLLTDAAGQFRVPNAPPGQPAIIRVRAGDRVNASLVFQPEELLRPVTIPVAAGNAFRVRGRVTDGRGRPVERAKLIVLANLRHRPQVPPVNPPAEGAPAAPAPLLSSFHPAEVVAVFTDAAGGFDSGPLWPGCSYTLTVSADGATSRRLREIEGRPGQVQELASISLSGTSHTVAGLVVGLDGRPVPGATVISSGDGPRRLTMTTDGAGRFSLSGLLDGPAVVVAHKDGFRWGQAVCRPGDAEPRIVLRALSEPPAVIPPLTDEHRRAEAELIRRLSELAAKALQGAPKPPVHEDPLAEARKDLDTFLAKQAKQPGTSPTHTLLALARELAKQDRARALRPLQEAAASAKRFTLSASQTGGSVLGMSFDMTGFMRTTELTHVAETALDLGYRAEGAGWLAEAETLALRLPEAQRRQPLVHLAWAWVTLDPARTEKALAGLDPIHFDLAVSSIVGRLLKTDPRKAVQWLERFKNADERSAQWSWSQVAVGLADRDLPKAVRLAEGIRWPVLRGHTLARLAVAAHKTDPKLAHELIARAAVDVVAESKHEEHEAGLRMGAAVALLWRARAVAYPDLASLVAVALTTRPPVPAYENQADTWRSQTVRLAAGVGSVDPATGRALLGPDRERMDGEDTEDTFPAWFSALALVDPAAALGYVKDELGMYVAENVLAVLKRRSTVAERFGLWEEGRAGGPDETEDDD
jgi:hypothetical protein